MEKAKCLITDSSGIAIEYIAILKRPVLYLDEFDKIHNNEFDDYSNLKTIDYKIKENFGYLFKKKDFNQIEEIIHKSIEDFANKQMLLDSFINENFSNFGKTKEYLTKILKKTFRKISKYNKTKDIRYNSLNNSINSLNYMIFFQIKACHYPFHKMIPF